jgi:hypothetical protein
VRRAHKRLTLNRETLVELDRSDLRPAVGVSGRTCPPICDFSNRNTCTTCQLTCTSNTC